MLTFISGAEIVFIFFIILLIFGADKIPTIARSLAKGMTQVRNATNEIKNEIQKTASKTFDVDEVFNKNLKGFEISEYLVKLKACCHFLEFSSALDLDQVSFSYFPHNQDEIIVF